MSKVVEWVLQDHVEHIKEAECFSSRTYNFVAMEPSYVKKLHVF